MKPYKPTLKKPSRLLRKNMTDAEQLLWSKLRRKQICGVQFNRQKPLLNFIVDFYCAKVKLVIELDGSQHFEDEYQIKDNSRDMTLQKMKLHVMRFDNRQVMMETERVLEEIYKYVKENLP